MTRRANLASHDVQCFRPNDIGSMQKQDVILKTGVSDELKLALLDEDKDNQQTISGWIDSVKMIIENNGMDTVFRIWDDTSTEIYM